VLKTESQKDRNDNGKRCTYCIDTKGWKGIGHTESECFTNKQEEKKAVKKGKTENDTSNGDSDIEDAITLNTRVRFIGQCTEEQQGLFQYDTATTHHSTNHLDLLQDICNDVSIAVEVHNGTKSTCNMIGILVFRHNGREIRHQDCLYNKSYSNLISRQRTESHVLKTNHNGAELKQERKIIYKMIRDTRGGL
jgi:hypothetical protein